MPLKQIIYYTLTDEAPALATYSWLPIVRGFTKAAGIMVETKDISLAARILACFPDYLAKDQRMPDVLAELEELVQRPTANIIKLPNISASPPQLQAAIRELQAQGHPLPDFPLASVVSVEEKTIYARYSKILGSVVNPILREGNSDRRVATSVKEYARKNPHTLGQWSQDSKSHVSSMSRGDFYASEKSIIIDQAMSVNIVWRGEDGQTQMLKEKIPLQAGEVIDAALMSCQALCEYYEEEMQKAKAEGVLLSLHLKATMMKVSDPIIFGHAVKIFYREVFKQYREEFCQLGVDACSGLGDVYSKIKNLSPAKQQEIVAAIEQVHITRPALAMVDSERRITNLHVPNNVIVDASLPAVIKHSGRMEGADGKLYDVKALIPDRCYAGIYQQVIQFCQQHKAFHVPSMGNVSNVGLMAKKAEEYGSHDTTFEIKGSGVVQVLGAEETVLIEHVVEKGDIWRMCQTQDVAIRDWVQLGVERARITGNPAIFWLDSNRAHDVHLVGKVKEYLQDHDCNRLEISIKSPQVAMLDTLERVRNGQDTISVTGNVLRDYLTDLFPILELGTSAKMLSIVPLLSGGGLYETGAGGSAPKHVQQFVKENHLRWDSLGEFLALAVSLDELARKTQKKQVEVLGKALDQANRQFLKMNKFPSRKVGELDSRGSHFYLALYWAEALSKQSDDLELQRKFSAIYRQLKTNETVIVAELQAVQGPPVDIGGHYWMGRQKVSAAMRPCALLNNIIDSI